MRKVSAFIALVIAFAASAGMVNQGGPRLFGVSSGGGGGGAACEFYIDDAGSDSNNGLTTGTPWAVTALNTKRSTYRGAVVCLMDGTYDLTNTNGVNLMNAAGTSYSAAALEVDGGTSGDPTIVKAVNARLAILDAKGSSGAYGGYTGGAHAQRGILRHGSGMTNQGNLTIDGIKFTGFMTGALSIGTYGVSSNLAGVTIQNCEFTDGNAQQPDSYIDNNYVIELNNGDGIVVRNNYLHDNAGRTGTSTFLDHWSAILQWSSKASIYEYNTFYNTGSVFGKRQGWASNVPSNTNTTLRYNYVEGAGIGGWLDHSQDVGGPASEFHHNIVIEANEGFNFNDSESQGPGAFTTWKVYNNTLVMDTTPDVNTQPHFMVGIEGTAQGTGEYYNNLMTGGIAVDRKLVNVNAKALGKWSYNLYPSTGLTYRIKTDTANQTQNADNSVAGYSTIASLQTGIQGLGGLSSSLVELGSVQTSQTLAQLFDLTGTFATKYKLKASTPSAAISAGKSDGTSGGSTVDIGAWGNLPGGVTRIGADFP